MPTNLVKPGQEKDWDRAKRLARKQYPNLSEDNPRFWRIVSTIFQSITGAKRKKAEK